MNTASVNRTANHTAAHQLLQLASVTCSYVVNVHAPKMRAIADVIGHNLRHHIMSEWHTTDVEDLASFQARIFRLVKHVYQQDGRPLKGGGQSLYWNQTRSAGPILNYIRRTYKYRRGTMAYQEQPWWVLARLT